MTVSGIGGLGGEHVGEATLHAGAELIERGGRRGGRQRLEALLQRDDERVVARQVATRVGELAALREQAAARERPAPANTRSCTRAAERLLLEPWRRASNAPESSAVHAG